MVAARPFPIGKPSCVLSSAQHQAAKADLRGPVASRAATKQGAGDGTRHRSRPARVNLSPLGIGRSMARRRSALPGCPVGVAQVRKHSGTLPAPLLGDGYAAYDAYARHCPEVKAQCWVHTRCYFEQATESDPTAIEALELIAALYRVECEIREQSSSLAQPGLSTAAVMPRRGPWPSSLVPRTTPAPRPAQ